MYGINGLKSTYERLPQNDFLVRVLEPRLEKQLAYDSKKELLIDEEQRFFDSALRCSSCIHAYHSFVNKYGDADLGVDFESRLKELDVYSGNFSNSQTPYENGCFVIDENELIE